MVCKINQFLKGCIRREHALVFCYLTDLTVISFNGICGIYKFTDSRSVLEVFRQFIPVLLPGPDDDRILFTPFYQWNRNQLTGEIALVSLGGTFSDGQIRQVLNRFLGARPFDCFDNDLPGRIYGLRMMALVENIPLKINRIRDSLEVEANGRSFRLDPERPFQVQVKEHLSVRYDMGQWLPPKAFKDWNDCLLNKPMDVRLHPTKQDQINNLAERRNAGPKL